MAALALVHNGVERISFSALQVDTLKPGSVWHRHLSGAARGQGFSTGAATAPFTRHSMDIRFAVFKKTAEAGRKN
jgi:hypothetical protein